MKGGVAIPGMLSFLVYGDAQRPVPALDDPATLPMVPDAHGQPHRLSLAAGETMRDYWPPVNVAFQTYHLMVALGMLFIVLGVAGTILLWRGRLFRMRWLLGVLVVAVLGPVAANQAGWVTAETGRQPWIVWGLMKTAHAASPAVAGGQVLASIILFSLIYILLLVIWLWLLDSKIKAGPEPVEGLAPAGAPGWLQTAAEFQGPSRTESLTTGRHRGA